MKLQRRLAARILKCSPKRVFIDPTKLTDIKEAITKTDIRGLIKAGAIRKIPKRGISRSRTRKRRQHLRKRHRGPGSKKGKMTARLPRKTVWKNRVRLQRQFLKELRNKKTIDKRTYQELYMRCKGGFFRSKRHIQLYLTELGVIKK